MIDLAGPRLRISGSRLLEIFAEYGVTSLADPFMRLPIHLNVLKSGGIGVHGGDLVDWFVRVGEGLIRNDGTVLRESDVMEIVEMVPGRLYPDEPFRAWDGVFFSEEQCFYLGVWLENVRRLRSEAQIGLAVLGLWRVLCYWLEKADHPDTMPDIAPSELAWEYLRATDRYVAPNRKRNTVRRAEATAFLAEAEADAVYLAPPGNPRPRPDPRIWMWEAWWHGDPYLNVERAFSGTLFDAPALDAGRYRDALAVLVRSAERFALVVVQTSEVERDAVEAALSAAGRTVEIRQPAPEELYLIARR